jgi:hypothetical protein
MSGFVVEMEMSAAFLAGIYRTMGWPLAMCDESTPTAADLKELLQHVAMEVQQDPGSYYSLGRIVAFQAAEVPGEVELALKIGRAFVDFNADADEPGPDRFFLGSLEHPHDDLPEGDA